MTFWSSICVFGKEVGFFPNLFLNFRRANFKLFKGLVAEILWNTVLTDKGAKQSWRLLKDVFRRARELSIPLHKKAGREGRQLG